MSRSLAIVFAIIFAVLVGGYLLIENMKEAYRILPGNTAGELEVPAFVEWREFIPASGKFKVMLPVVPQYAKETVSIPDTNQKRWYEMFVSEKMDSTLFLISLITYPPGVDISNTEMMLRGIVDEMVYSKVGNKLKEFENTTFQNHQAVRFDIVSKEFNIKGIAMMVDKTTYLLTYVAKEDNFNEAEYQHFITSFQLTPPKLS